MKLTDKEFRDICMRAGAPDSDKTDAEFRAEVESAGLTDLRLTMHRLLDEAAEDAPVDPVEWLAAARARCAEVELELRSPMPLGVYVDTDLQSIRTRPA